MRHQWLNHLQAWLFKLLLALATLGALWISQHYYWRADVTANQSNTLTEATQLLLTRLEHPLKITAFTNGSAELDRHITELIGKYQKIYPDIKLEIINIDEEPDLARQLDIKVNGEMVMLYQRRSKRVKIPLEHHVSNALQTLLKAENEFIVFLTGHGERSITTQGRHDISAFASKLEQQGIQTESLALAQIGAIPDNTRVMVIASPQTALLPGEKAMVMQYVQNGGNLLWLSEPGSLHGLDALAESLALSPTPGLLVDLTGKFVFGIEQHDFVVVTEYPAHPITQNLQNASVFPTARAWEAEIADDWKATSILFSSEKSWTELGDVVDTIQYDEDSDEQRGPLAFGWALTRPHPNLATGEQRIAVLGDGDFLANTYLGNGVNLDLGTNLIKWLTGDDQLLDIVNRPSLDHQLNLSLSDRIVLVVIWLIAVPILLFLAGVIIWWRRKRR